MKARATNIAPAAQRRPRFGCDAEICVLSGARLWAEGFRVFVSSMLFPSVFKPLWAAAKNDSLQLSTRTGRTF
jgi:hypothetical protein